MFRKSAIFRQNQFSNDTNCHRTWPSPVLCWLRCRIWAWIEWWLISWVRKACHLMLESCEVLTRWKPFQDKFQDVSFFSDVVWGKWVCLGQIMLNLIIQSSNAWILLGVNEAIARPHGCGAWFRAQASGVSSKPQRSWPKILDRLGRGLDVLFSSPPPVGLYGDVSENSEKYGRINHSQDARDRLFLCFWMLLAHLCLVSDLETWLS